MEFNTRLTNLLKEQNLTSNMLAKLIKVNNKKVKGWESGDKLPNLFELVELCKVFNCSSDYLLGVE